MKAIIGLGNPGSKYEHTRHNVGFLVLDELAKRHGESFRSKSAVEAEVAEVMAGEKLLLVKPQTFMNVVSRSLGSIMKKYPVAAQDILIVYDEADLNFGDIRFKLGGSSAGHNGVKSILSCFQKGTSIARVRVGIGRPSHPDIPLEDFVLQKWTSDEANTLPQIIDSTITIIEQEWL